MKFLYPISIERSRSAGSGAVPLEVTSGRRWILAVLLCVGLLMPGANVFARLAAVTVNPVVDTNIDLNLPVSTTAEISASLLHATDPDTIPTLLVYTIITPVTKGTLKSGVNTLVQGSTFTQQNINDGLLKYTAPAAVNTDSFTFRVSDGTGQTANLVYTIHINKPEPDTYPSAFTAVANSVSQITTTWTDASGGITPDGYVVLCSPDSMPAAPLDTTTPINNTCADGSGSIHIAKGVGTVTWTGLSSETTYHFAIFPYAQTPYTLTTGAFFDYLTKPNEPRTSATTLKTYSISGTITETGGVTPIMGVLVDAGNGHTAISGEDGTYTLTDLVPGEYVITPSKPCYTFDPVTATATVSEINSHVTGKDFTGTLWTCIRGNILEGGHPLSGVLISNGTGRTTLSLEDGSYGFPVPDNWSGTLFPTKINYFFTPDRRSYLDVTTNQFVQGYTAYKIAVTYHGFTAAWAGVEGATGYYLDVATDAKFTSFVSGYENKDVGNVTQFDVPGLSPHTHYFFRVRAHDAVQTDGNSIPTEVFTDWAVFLPFVGR